jgi:hypothetical protein
VTLRVQRIKGLHQVAVEASYIHVADHKGMRSTGIAAIRRADAPRRPRLG